MSSVRGLDEIKAPTVRCTWEKTCGLKFELTSRTIIQPNGGTREVPCYMLTKTECLYIATKFNDEARAKLVLRWQTLWQSIYSISGSEET